MSNYAAARRNLTYVDPAEFTPQFAWKKSARNAEAVHCEAASLSSIAQKFGTPVYVYSRRAIENAFDELKQGLGHQPHLICFAMKANANLSILQLLAKRGSGFDIVSGGELEHLARIGVPGNRIVFSGVGKTREEIRAALNYKARKPSQPGILQFNVESAPELDVLLEEAAKHRKRSAVLPGVSVRVNPDVAAGGHPHISTGKTEHKFGLGWQDARALYLTHKDSRIIRWQGISAHIGSQIIAIDAFDEALSRLVSYVQDLRANGIHLACLDFGGGLGVRYTSETPPTRIEYARRVADLVKPLGIRLLLEPGRTVIGPACVLLSKVIYVKRGQHKSFVVLDAAMNDLTRPALYDAAHPVTLVSRNSNQAHTFDHRVDVVGPVCETGDTFLMDWPLGNAAPGDVVAIWIAGAYGMAQACNYNGRTRPAEVLVSGKKMKLIRRRETQADLVRTDVLG